MPTTVTGARLASATLCPPQYPAIEVEHDRLYGQLPVDVSAAPFRHGAGHEIEESLRSFGGHDLLDVASGVGASDAVDDLGRSAATLCQVSEEGGIHLIAGHVRLEMAL